MISGEQRCARRRETHYPSATDTRDETHLATEPNSNSDSEFIESTLAAVSGFLYGPGAFAEVSTKSRHSAP